VKVHDRDCNCLSYPTLQFARSSKSRVQDSQGYPILLLEGRLSVEFTSNPPRISGLQSMSATTGKSNVRVLNGALDHLESSMVLIYYVPLFPYELFFALLL